MFSSSRNGAVRCHRTRSVTGFIPARRLSREESLLAVYTPLPEYGLVVGTGDTRCGIPRAGRSREAGDDRGLSLPEGLDHRLAGSDMRVLWDLGQRKDRCHTGIQRLEDALSVVAVAGAEDLRETFSDARPRVPVVLIGEISGVQTESRL